MPTDAPAHAAPSAMLDELERLLRDADATHNFEPAIALMVRLLLEAPALLALAREGLAASAEHADLRAKLEHYDTVLDACEALAVRDALEAQEATRA